MDVDQYPSPYQIVAESIERVFSIFAHLYFLFKKDYRRPTMPKVRRKPRAATTNRLARPLKAAQPAPPPPASTSTSTSTVGDVKLRFSLLFRHESRLGPAEQSQVLRFECATERNRQIKSDRRLHTPTQSST